MIDFTMVIIGLSVCAISFSTIALFRASDMTYNKESYRELLKAYTSVQSINQQQRKEREDLYDRWRKEEIQRVKAENELTALKKANGLTKSTVEEIKKDK